MATTKEPRTMTAAAVRRLTERPTVDHRNGASARVVIAAGAQIFRGRDKVRRGYPDDLTAQERFWLVARQEIES